MKIYKTTYKYKLAALFLGCILILSGCSSSAGTKNNAAAKNISVKDIASKNKRFFKSYGNDTD